MMEMINYGVAKENKGIKSQGLKNRSIIGIIVAMVALGAMAYYSGDFYVDSDTRNMDNQYGSYILRKDF